VGSEHSRKEPSRKKTDALPVCSRVPVEATLAADRRAAPILISLTEYAGINARFVGNCDNVPQLQE
jgi:hypothetical protein